jgi:hypothetical protein
MGGLNAETAFCWYVSGWVSGESKPAIQNFLSFLTRREDLFVLKKA